ncbi:MAG: hypothetical protein IPO99_08185 [Nitrospira sp.]|nr:hypothetical protein [Nitrospira sp.]
MFSLRRLMCAVCACLAGFGALPAAAEVAPAQSSSIARVDIGLSEWFSQVRRSGATTPQAWMPTWKSSSKLKYKDTGTNVTEISGRVQLKNKIFFRGAFGYGSIGGGRLTDDDFLSAQGAAAQGATVSGEHRFSRTFSDTGGDNLWYLERGYRCDDVHLSRKNKGTLGMFVGLQYWRSGMWQTGSHKPNAPRHPLRTRVFVGRLPVRSGSVTRR